MYYQATADVMTPLPNEAGLLQADVDTVDAMLLMVDRVREAFFDLSREDIAATGSIVLERLRILDGLICTQRNLLADRLADSR